MAATKFFSKKPMNDYIRTFNSYLQELFSERVYKIAIDAGFSCPNRDGTKGVNGCIYCDERGSSSRTNASSTPIREQILKNIAHRKIRYKAKKFIAHFQSYTNTYAPLEKLKELYDEAISSSEEIVGLSISTRADCVDEEKMALIASYQKHLPFVQVEFGLQTIHNRTRDLLNRCEKYEDFVQALSWTKKFSLHHCAHVILGLPGESQEEQMQTAKALADLQIEGVKIHFLVALENTSLAQQYLDGLWQPPSFEEHISLTCDFLERLPPSTIIHRISGNGHPLHLIAPLWMKEKKEEILPALKKEFLRRNSRQGSRYLPP
jgi:uncharacterized protein